MGMLERRIEELRGRTGGQHARPAAPRAAARTLEQILGGREARCGELAHWELAVPIQAGECTIDIEALANPIQCEARGIEAVTVDPGRTLILDIETGGFSGAPVFLIGVIALGRRLLCVEQWLARDYPEEKALLLRLAERSRRRRAWITFNGKSFDLPFLLDRATVHGVDLRPPEVHVDLLHLARRRWRKALPDCRLGTLERLILGRTRVGDVPSCDVPDLFHHFIRTGNAAPLRPVLEHNRFDLISSAELLLRLTCPRPAE
jgi:uncharacterized protein YprB with RNaseH-like and TPR domain